MNFTVEWFREAKDRCWHFGHDDLFKFRAQAWALSVSFDRVPVSNTLRQFMADLRKLRHELLIRK
jgi:hypothetical protein